MRVEVGFGPKGLLDQSCCRAVPGGDLGDPCVLRLGWGSREGAPGASSCPSGNKGTFRLKEGDLGLELG